MRRESFPCGPITRSDVLKKATTNRRARHRRKVQAVARPLLVHFRDKSRALSPAQPPQYPIVSCGRGLEPALRARAENRLRPRNFLRGQSQDDVLGRRPSIGHELVGNSRLLDLTCRGPGPWRRRVLRSRFATVPGNGCPEERAVAKGWRQSSRVLAGTNAALSVTGCFG